VLRSVVSRFLFNTSGFSHTLEVSPLGVPSGTGAVDDEEEEEDIDDVDGGFAGDIGSDLINTANGSSPSQIGGEFGE
jgi:hypothetical protein